MGKLLFVVLFVLGVILSGCSGNFSGGNAKIGNVKIDNTGFGLEVNFNLDTADILSKKVYYSIDLINSGQSPIKLSRNNFKLSSLETKNSGKGYIFTSASLENFYLNIFKNSNPMFQNERREGIVGTLIIDDYWFNNLNKKSLQYNLDVNYDYETNFSNNVELDLSAKSSNKFKLIDSLSQAAPVKVNKIDLKPGISNGEYVLSFNIVDSNRFGKSFVKFKSINLKFKTQDLNNCKYFTNFNGNLKPVIFENFNLGNKNKNLEVKCQVFLQSNQNLNAITTQVSGTIKYNYLINLQGNINLPENRISDPIFN